MNKNNIPKSLRPLTWGLKWDSLNLEEDKEDIIVNVVNEGTLDQWKWLIGTYGKDTIHAVLERRLASEFHPESRNLAKVLFSLNSFHYARGGVN